MKHHDGDDALLYCDNPNLFQQQHLVTDVESADGFIKQQNLRLPHQGLREIDQLALATA